MGRIMAIDVGQKRIGLAVTDESRIIATALDTIHVKDIWSFLKEYLLNENVDSFVVGDPKQMNNQSSDSVKYIEPFVKKLKKNYPAKPVEFYDERFTSVIAQREMISMGMKKKDRQNKNNVDKISAVLILQSYMAFKKLNL